MPDAKKVGYRKPPQATRFAKGKSGNPSGRPKGSRNLSSDLRDELSERIMVTEGGVRRTISKQRGLIKTLCTRSIQGDARAVAQLVKLVATYLGEDEPAAPDEIGTDDEKVLRLHEERILRRARKITEEENG